MPSFEAGRSPKLNEQQQDELVELLRERDNPIGISKQIRRVPVLRDFVEPILDTASRRSRLETAYQYGLSVKTEGSAVGFYALNGRSVVSWKEAEEKERICEVLATIREQNPGKRILLILDKHASHVCEYTYKRAHQLGIGFIFFPSGSPHLNPLEQVWKHLKWITAQIIVEDEDEFHELIKDVFDQVTQQISFVKNWCEKSPDFKIFLDHYCQQESLTVYIDSFRAYEPLDEDGEYVDGNFHVNTSERHGSLMRS